MTVRLGVVIVSLGVIIVSLGVIIVSLGDIIVRLGDTIVRLGVATARLPRLRFAPINEVDLGKSPGSDSAGPSLTKIATHSSQKLIWMWS